MGWPSLCATAILLSFARVNVADGDSANEFIFPTSSGPSENYVADLMLPLGSTQKIQWTTNLSSYSIWLYHQLTSPVSAIPIEAIYNTTDSSATEQHSFDWKVQTYNANQNASPVYFLWINPGNTMLTCHYFNITTQSSSSSSSSAPTASSSSTSNVLASSTSIPSPSLLSPAPVTTSSVSSSTDTLKAGLGVGLGLGIPLVLIAGIWIGLQTVKQRRVSSGSAGARVPLSQYPDDIGDLPRSSSPPKDLISEADPIHEAPENGHEYAEAPTDRPLVELAPSER